MQLNIPEVQIAGPAMVRRTERNPNFQYNGYSLQNFQNVQQPQAPPIVSPPERAKRKRSQRQTFKKH